MSTILENSDQVRFGSEAPEALNGSDGDTLFGLAGNDQLSSLDGSVSLNGGYGNDRYEAGAEFTQIADAGGRDSLNLSGSFADYQVGLVDYRHLLLHNAETGENVLVLDWQGQGRIEAFTDAQGATLYEGQIGQALFDPTAPLAISSLGALAPQQAMQLLGEEGLTAQQFVGQLAIEAQIGQIDLHEVAGQVAELNGDPANPADVAQAFATAVQHHLSPLEQQAWNELDYDGQFTAEAFESLDLSGYLDESTDGTDEGTDGADESTDGADENTDGSEESTDGSGENTDGSDENADGSEENTEDGQVTDPDEIDADLSDAEQLFDAVLDREMSAEERAEWSEEVEDGVSLLDMADDILDMDEFEERFAVEEDADFVDQVVANLTDGEGSADTSVWVDALENGADRDEVLLDIVDTVGVASAEADAVQTVA